MFSTVTLLVVLGSLSTVVGTGRQQALGCEGSHLSLSCPAGQTLRILRANYGRLSGSVCQGAGQGAGAGRCIQPTSLRTLTGLCGGQGRCQVEVDSKQFGDPCPGTSKYLELVYTCANREEESDSPLLPPWLRSLEAMTRKVVQARTETPPPTTTTTTHTTHASKFQHIHVRTSPAPLTAPSNHIREPSAEFLHYLQSVRDKQLLLNKPREMEQEQEAGAGLLAGAGWEVQLAVVAASLLTLLTIAITVAILLARRLRVKRAGGGVDTESTASTYLHPDSTYLQYPANLSPGQEYGLVLGRDGKLYQPILLSPDLVHSPAAHTTKLAKIQENCNEYAEIGGSYRSLPHL